MKEIYGGNLGYFFEKHPEYDAKCTYQKENKWEGMIEIWELSDDNFKKLENISEEEWSISAKDGWWRYAEGCNMGVPNKQYIINDFKITAWDGSGRDDWQRSCKDCSDMMIGYCRGLDEDVEECYHERKYENLFDYLWNEIGASQPRNVCALAKDLAKYNNVTMGTLFTMLQ